MYLDMDGINMTISGASVVPPMRGANILRFTTAVSTTRMTAASYLSSGNVRSEGS
jgi:hypothetical protein